MPPLIVPLTPSAVPATPSDPAPAAASAAGQSTFADALSRAGAPAQSVTDNVAATSDSPTGHAADASGTAGAAQQASPVAQPATGAQGNHATQASGRTTGGAAAQSAVANRPASGRAVGAGSMSAAGDPSQPATDAALQPGAVEVTPAAATVSGKILPQGTDKPQPEHGTPKREDGTAQPAGLPQALAMLIAVPAAGAATPGAGSAPAAASDASPRVGMNPATGTAARAALPRALESAATSASGATGPRQFTARASSQTAPMQTVTDAVAGQTPAGLLARLHDTAAPALESPSATKPAGASAMGAQAPSPLTPVVAQPTLQVPATAAVAAGSTAAAAVQPPVGSPAWGQAMSQQVLIAVQGQQQIATLHLNPPQLGPLAVHLQVQEGQVQAQFISPHAAVRQAVEAALPQLHDMFGNAGLTLLQTSVGAQGGQPSRQGWSQRRGTGLAAGAAVSAVAAGEAQPATALHWRKGLVNTYV
jgi:flagellar hook-length control protein FliK